MEWNEFLLGLLYAVLTAAIPAVTVFLMKYLSSKFDKIKLDTQNAIFNDTIASALDIIYNVVSSTSQTYVDSLKSSGEFTAEAQEAAFNKTKETVMYLLNDETKSLLSTIYKDLDEWIDIQIEAAVRNSKLNQSPVTTLIKEGDC